MKNKYADCSSFVTKRGEEAYPLMHYKRVRNWQKIAEFMDLIPYGGERLMRQDEVMLLYD